MNSNTFQDQPGQPLSYKFGSLTHADAATRAQAIAHNIECIEIGRALGSKALTVWIGDGSNFPGQANFTRQFERYLDAMRAGLCGAARRLARCSPNTRCTSRPSIPRWCRTGARTT